MVKIIGVRFRSAGKIYYFSPESLEMKAGDSVIVETARGIECGRVVLSPTEVDEKEIVQPLKSVIRVATPEDEAHAAENRKKAKEAFFICKQRIRKHELDMKLIDAEYTFDNKKALFYFTADGRVDFRELIKDLAAVFKTRIELRQIGVRDETKLLGGYGICGRPLCCAGYLSDFVPVSIKMAKEQNLSLNPTKISGVCGRLMCCLKNEEDTYEYLNRRMPNIGDTVQASDGTVGDIISVDILKQEVRVLVQTEDDDKEIQKFAADDLTVTARRRKGRGKKPVQEMQESQVAEEVKEQLGKQGKAAGGRRKDQAQANPEKAKTAELEINDPETNDFAQESQIEAFAQVEEQVSFEAGMADAINEGPRTDQEESGHQDPATEEKTVSGGRNRGKNQESEGKGQERNGRNRSGRGRNRDQSKDQRRTNVPEAEDGAEDNQSGQNNRGRGRRDQHRNHRDHQANANQSTANNNRREQNAEKDGKKEQVRREHRNHEDHNREGKAGEEGHDQRNANRKNREGSGNRRNHGRDRRNRDRMPKEQGKENNAENN